MMVGAGPAIQGVDAATGARSERVARRMAELYANDTQVRDARPRKDFASAALRPGMRLSQIVAIVMAGYADRPALGQRAHELVTDPATGRRSVRLRSEFETISYRELWARVGVVASECQHHPEYPLSAGDFVCLLGFTSTDYTTIDLACIYMGVVSVPLQTSAPAEQHRAIMAETKPRIVAVGIDSLDVAVEAVLAGAAPDRMSGRKQGQWQSICGGLGPTRTTRRFGSGWTRSSTTRSRSRRRVRTTRALQASNRCP
jgi:fatty acid CoA ligase FadD9